MVFDLCQLGSVQITNGFGMTIVTLNPTMQEAIDFKQKLVLHIYHICNQRNTILLLKYLDDFFRLLGDELPLAIYGKQNHNKMVRKEQTDWNEIEVMSINEILAAYEVILPLSVIFIIILFLTVI